MRDAFVSNFEEFGEVGAAVAVTIDGKPVIDLWGGEVDKDTMNPWQRETIVTVYTTTKGMTTICAHRLVEQGLTLWTNTGPTSPSLARPRYRYTCC